MGTLIALLLLGGVAGLVIFGFFASQFMASSVNKQQDAIKNQESLLAEFFDGQHTRVYSTVGTHLPPERVIENAHRFGYRLISQSESDYNRTFVFERV